MKRLFSDKGPCQNETITLMEIEKLVSEAMSVANGLNEHYISVTKNVGKSDCLVPDDNIEDVIKHHETHSSVKYFKMCACNTTFSFEEVRQIDVYRSLRNIHCNKSEGFDKIYPMLIKSGALELSKPAWLDNQYV